MIQQHERQSYKVKTIAGQKELQGLLVWIAFSLN